MGRSPPVEKALDWTSSLASSNKTRLALTPGCALLASQLVIRSTFAASNSGVEPLELFSGT
jgi:hypothetical protein